MIKFALVVLVLLEPISALKFDLQPTKVKCFSEDIPDSTLVLGKYDVQYLGQAPSNETVEVQPSINVQVLRKPSIQLTVLELIYPVLQNFESLL